MSEDKQHTIALYDKDCTACGACANICPKSAISLLPDERGFYVPQIDSGKCTDCGLCKKVCPIGRKKMLEIPGFMPEVYAAYAKNDSIRRNSSSGGIFSLLADIVLQNNGVVYGAAFDEKFRVKHIGIRSREELSRLRGSKYVQSFIAENLYCEIKKELERGTQVLFTGTPCQVAGLKSFLQQEYQNLLLVDLLCHGVPSPGVFAAYLEDLEQKYGRITFYSFRDKNKSWKIYNSKTVTDRGTVIKYMTQDFFLFLFRCAEQPFLRDSCYNCAFADRGRISDITIGDFWDYKNSENLHDDDRGLSCIICNSSKGKMRFQELLSELNYELRSLAEAEIGNRSLYSPVRGSLKSRTKFWEIFLSEGIAGVRKKYYIKSLKSRIILFVYFKCRWLYRILEYFYRLTK